jgi:hypothetical protein
MRSVETYRQTLIQGNPLSDQHQSRERKQAEAAFAKQQSQPIPMPDDVPPESLADENMAKQKAARLARDAAKPAAKKR